MKSSLLGLVFVLALTVSAWSDSGLAQAYPERPVRIIVPYPAGGGVDTAARILGKHLADVWSAGVVIENRSGATGTIGAEAVAKAQPDGYTLLLAPNGPWLWGPVLRSFSPNLYRKLPFDGLKDFAPVGMMSSGPYVLVVTPSLSVTSVQQLIALAKSRPGELTFASAGNGSPVHLAGELFKKIAKIDILHVPYKGSAPAITDLLSGRVSMAFQVMPLTLPYTATGKLKALAVTAAKRFPSAPDIPTMEEAGVPGVNITQWSGIFAPAGTPEAILDKLHNEIAKVVSREDVRQELLAQGFEPSNMTRAEFRDFLLKDINAAATLIRDSGVPVE